MKIYQSFRIKFLVFFLFFAGTVCVISFLLNLASFPACLRALLMAFMCFSISYYYWKRGKEPLCETTMEGIRAGKILILWKDIEKAICYRGIIIKDSAILFVIKEEAQKKYPEISAGKIHFMCAQTGLIGTFEIPKKQRELLIKEIKLFVPVEEK